jgi:MoaA/NifB/PqqE/SkfB family radical SAM enzyme
MCGYGGKPIDKELFMNWNTFTNTLGQIDADEIRLNGRGESTIHPDINNMIKFAAKTRPNAQLELFTNGSWKESTGDMFFRNNVRLYISMDSLQPENLENIRKGVSYSHLLRQIESLGAIQPRPFIVFTLQNRNAHEVFQIATFAWKKRMNIIYNVIHIASEEIDRKHLVKYVIGLHKAYELYKSTPELKCIIPDQVQGLPMNFETVSTNNAKNKCPAVDNELCILYNGDILPCNMFCPETLGNIRDLENMKDFKDQADHWHCKSCASMTGSFGS